ncbi:GNAT family N-acetyltransferase [Frigoribacterium sp. 2-23]|uniref:GNAT family N-acetyltransferase n=1 Tax=Frigoribacterium sp. 2-23 TaxID=3415006 RepID=UPI003C6FAA5B
MTSTRASSSSSSTPTSSASSAAATDDLVVSPLADDRDAEAFRTLNEQWIVELFALEPADVATLGDPRGRIVDRGGVVLMARRGGRVVGTVALIADASGDVFELSKMAVAPSERGRGAGRRLITAAIEEARQRGALRVFLGSSTKLPAAVGLYESVGFEHVPASELGLPYVRADVFMRLELG